MWRWRTRRTSVKCSCSALGRPSDRLSRRWNDETAQKVVTRRSTISSTGVQKRARANFYWRTALVALQQQTPAVLRRSSAPSCPITTSDGVHYFGLPAVTLLGCAGAVNIQKIILIRRTSWSIIPFFVHQTVLTSYLSSSFFFSSCFQSLLGFSHPVYPCFRGFISQYGHLHFSCHATRIDTILSFTGALLQGWPDLTVFVLPRSGSCDSLD